MDVTHDGGEITLAIIVIRSSLSPAVDLVNTDTIDQLSIAFIVIITGTQHAAAPKTHQRTPS
jgi:hypothetical protein